jgi:hypothetical protein
MVDIRHNKRFLFFVLCALFFYREAVTPRSPGLLQPWVIDHFQHQPQRGCAADATRSGLKRNNAMIPGLKQPWVIDHS